MANTTSVLQLMLYAAYYLVIAVLAVFSLTGIFLLAAHGRNRILSLVVSFAFIFIFLTLLGTTQVTLSSIF